MICQFFFSGQYPATYEMTVGHSYTHSLNINKKERIEVWKSLTCFSPWSYLQWIHFFICTCWSLESYQLYFGGSTTKIPVWSSLWFVILRWTYMIQAVLLYTPVLDTCSTIKLTFFWFVSVLLKGRHFNMFNRYIECCRGSLFNSLMTLIVHISYIRLLRLWQSETGLVRWRMQYFDVQQVLYSV